MSKQRPGLPADFELSVAREEPVEIPDYLDRELRPTQPPPASPAPEPRERIPAVPKPESAAPAKRDEKVLRLPREKKRSGGGVTNQVRSPRARELRRPPRKELSLDAETQRKAEEVVTDISEQGPQPDATASEFVRGLVQLAHDVRHKADYSHLNRRGQWGSATARAFVADLKEAFLRAVGQHYIDRYPREARQQLDSAESPSNA